jgi:DNA-directed RNA polymerase specialized sigma24 family protein
MNQNEQDSTDAERSRQARLRQETEIQRATQAAIAGDPATLIEALYTSGLLDGIAWRLRSQLPEDDVDFIISEAIRCTYQAIHLGRQEIDLASWLCKTCYNMAGARYAMRKNVVFLESSDLDRRQQTLGRREFTTEHTNPEEQEEEREKRRIAAVQIARSLLPKIGEENIQRVMAVVLDAVEQDVVDLPHRAIAEAVGLSVGTVQRLVSRGFERLEREAKREGLWLDSVDSFVLEQENHLDHGELEQ